MNAAPLVSGLSSLDALPRIASALAADYADIDALLAGGEPILLRGAIDHWPALQAAARSPADLDAYLSERDGGAPVPVMEAPPSSGGRFAYAADPREFSFTKRMRPLGETLERIARAATGDAGTFLAIQMLPLETQMPAFVRDNPMPLVPAGARAKLWLGGPVKTQTHNDRDHNLACVIAGHRPFLLFPPEQVGNLYIGPLDNPPPLSFVDPERPDFAAYPRYREALKSARVAHLGPGDAILMPRYWWHHVTSLDRYNAMVNYWWGQNPVGLENPQEAFLAALLALKTLSPRERDYWRAMFETFVF
ncbi:MAG TPA: cupin-like domain-containing protein, partial [Sphingomicrobium sp.]|nr:cupin-like domain-containing protein [Sphingomicrobium sp.]